MTEINEIDEFNTLYEKYRSIITLEKLKKEILYHELITHTGEQIDNPERFHQFIEETFARFTPEYFGTQLEDNEWIVHKKGSHRYPLKDNETIFENSLKVVHNGDKVTLDYIKALKGWFERHIKPESNMKIKLKIIGESDNILWIVFYLIY